MLDSVKSVELNMSLSVKARNILCRKVLKNVRDQTFGFLNTDDPGRKVGGGSRFNATSLLPCRFTIIFWRWRLLSVNGVLQPRPLDPGNGKRRTVPGLA